MSNLDKRIWGPIIWDMIHIISTKFINSNQTDIFKKIYRYFILEIIPCSYCYNSYHNFINGYIINYRDLEYKLYLYHNSVNRKLNKREITLSEYDMLNYHSKCCGVINRNLDFLLHYYLENNAHRNYINMVKEFKTFINNNRNFIFHNKKNIM